MKDEIELRHLRYFLAVAETLHFGRAATKLGIAQPPLSQQIRRLEEMLGAQLFERTTRGVKLTPAGSTLRERARSTMARLADDLEQSRRVARGEEGRLTVGFSGSVMFTELPMAIQAYRRAYPRVDVQLREMWTSDQLAALADGSIDVGLSERWRATARTYDYAAAAGAVLCGAAGRPCAATPAHRGPGIL